MEIDDEITEEMFSGFCKTFNETRDCDLRTLKKTDGGLRLSHADCAYERCSHRETCLVMQPVRDMERASEGKNVKNPPKKNKKLPCCL